MALDNLKKLLESQRSTPSRVGPTREAASTVQPVSPMQTAQKAQSAFTLPDTRRPGPTVERATPQPVQQPTISTIKTSTPQMATPQELERGNKFASRVLSILPKGAIETSPFEDDVKKQALELSQKSEKALARREKVDTFAKRTAANVAIMGSDTVEYLTDFFLRKPERLTYLQPTLRTPGLFKAGEIVSKLKENKGTQEATPVQTAWAKFYDEHKDMLPANMAAQAADRLQKKDFMQPDQEWVNAPLTEKITTRLPQTIYEVGPSIVSTFGLYALTGPIAASAVVAGSTAQDVKEEAMQYGMGADDAEKLGAATGIAVAAFERIVPERVLGDGGQAYFARTFAKKLVNYALELGETGILEATTEGLQEGVEKLAASTYRELTGRDLEDIALSAILGGPSGAGFKMSVDFVTNVASGDLPAGLSVKEVSDNVSREMRIRRLEDKVIEARDQGTPVEVGVQEELGRLRSEQQAEDIEAAKPEPEQQAFFKEESITNEVAKEIQKYETVEQFTKEAEINVPADSIVVSDAAQDAGPITVQLTENGTLELTAGRELFNELASVDKTVPVMFDPSATLEEFFGRGVRQMVPAEQAAQASREILNRLKFEDVEIKFADQILTGQGAAFASSYGKDITFTEFVPKYAGQHEAMHTIVRNMDNMQIFKDAGVTKQDLFNEAQVRYPNITKDTDLEEQLAEDFELYVDERLKNKPVTAVGKIKKFFEKVFDTIQKMFRGDNRPVVNKFYDTILEGKAKTPTKATAQSDQEQFRRRDTERVVYDFGRVDPAYLAAHDVFGGFKDLTTKFIDRALVGRNNVSRSFVENEINRPDYKQAEKDIIAATLQEFDGERFDAQEFADSVKAKLLPLAVNAMNSRTDPTRHSSIVLSDDLRGDPDAYFENIYESPIKTSAGNVHFHGLSDSYFAHSRAEDFGDMRRVIELQSDLFQRGRLDKERLGRTPEGEKSIMPERDKKAAARDKELEQLEVYKNTWWQRVIREEIKRAAAEGMTKLQFPTGKTAAYIEGYVEGGEAGVDENAAVGDTVEIFGDDFIIIRDFGDSVDVLRESDIKNQFDWEQAFQEDIDNITYDLEQGELDNYDTEIVNVLGEEEYTQMVAGNWEGDWVDVATDIMDARIDEYGTPSAEAYRDYLNDYQGAMYEASENGMIYFIDGAQSETVPRGSGQEEYNYDELHDSQKRVVDFYNKDIQKYLKKIRPEMEVVTDENGVTWYELNLNKADIDAPVAAFKINRNEFLKADDYVRRARQEFKQSPEYAKIEYDMENTRMEKTGINENIVKGIRNSRYYRKELAIKDDMGRGWLMTRDRRGNTEYVVSGPSDVKSYEERGYERDIEVDMLAQEAGWDNGFDWLQYQLDIANKRIGNEQLLVNDYLEKNDQRYKDALKTIREVKAELAKGTPKPETLLKEAERERLKNLRARGRRDLIRGLKDYYGLNDYDIRKITKKDIRYMTQEEFDRHLKYIENRAAQLSAEKQARNELFYVMQEKELEKVENLQRALKLPPVRQMSVDQMNEFADTLQQFEDGDTFLTQRLIETIGRTDIGDIKTERELRDSLIERFGYDVATLTEQDIFNRSDWIRFDAALAQKNPFYKLVVNRTHSAFMREEAEFYAFHQQLQKLTRAARKSRQKGFKQKVASLLAPQDKLVFEWLDGDNETKIKVAEKMTQEEIDLAFFVYDFFSSARQHLEANEMMSNFRENYITHIRKSTLESLVYNGPIEAVRNAFSGYKTDSQSFNIMAGKTGEIVPLEKFFKFSLRRTGEIDPTLNVARAVESYARNFYRKKAIDSFTPEIYAYTKLLTPSTKTPRGLDKDPSLETFITSYLNTKRGRYAMGENPMLQQGGPADVALQAFLGVTRLLDLGLSFPTQIAAFGGEQSMEYIMLGGKNYAKGIARSKTKKGRELAKKYQQFVGEPLWQELTDVSKNMNNKAATAMFAGFHESSRQANMIHLFGSMTDAEWKAGEISNDRLSQLQIDMNRYRAIGNTNSVTGATTYGKVINQYKSWAIPIAYTVSRNLKVLSADIQKNGIRALKTREAQELLRSSIAASFAVAVAYATADWLEDTWVGDVSRRVARDLMSIIAAMNPTLFIGEPRVVSFIGDLSTSLDAIITGDAWMISSREAGLKKFGRTVKPALFKQISNFLEDVAPSQGPSIRVPDIRVPDVNVPDININL